VLGTGGFAPNGGFLPTPEKVRNSTHETMLISNNN